MAQNEKKCIYFSKQSQISLKLYNQSCQVQLNSGDSSNPMSNNSVLFRLIDRLSQIFRELQMVFGAATSFDQISTLNNSNALNPRSTAPRSKNIIRKLYAVYSTPAFPSSPT